jgi:hypothetical protein
MAQFPSGAQRRAGCNPRRGIRVNGHMSRRVCGRNEGKS